MISFTRYISEDASKGLKGKAEKSGMPLGILRKVYNRGVAAWKSGHRPGTTPEQWGMARVNSFTTKSSGTWGKADKDLAQKVRKEEVELEEMKNTHALINTADGNKVVAMASSEDGVKQSKASAQRPPMSIKDKNTLKIVKLKKPVSQKASDKIMGRPLNEETLDEVVQRPLYKGATVKGKFNGKVISGKIVDTPIVQNKAGVTVHWKSGQKGNFPNDHFDTKGHHKSMSEEVELDEAYKEPQGQAKRMMSPLQKARMDKEKADRDRDGKLMNVKRKPKTEGKSFNDFREANTPVGQRDKMKITDRKPHPDGGHIITLQTKTGKTIKRHLKNGKVKDLEEAQLAELTAAEKKLVNQMYDKKGNLTPLGKKVMDHNKKPGDKAKG